MIKRKLTLSAVFACPIEDGRIQQRQLVPARLAQDETLFAIANGYLGMRGTFISSWPTLAQHITVFPNSVPMTMGGTGPPHPGLP